MRAVWLQATARLRGRVRVSVLLALLVGLAGGLVRAAAGGQPAQGAQRNLGLGAHRVGDRLSPAPKESGSRTGYSHHPAGRPVRNRHQRAL
jgi:hypothetical protein